VATICGKHQPSGNVGSFMRHHSPNRNSIGHR